MIKYDYQNAFRWGTDHHTYFRNVVDTAGGLRNTAGIWADAGPGKFNFRLVAFIGVKLVFHMFKYLFFI